LTAHSQDLARGRELTLRLPIEIELPRIETFLQPPDAARWRGRKGGVPSSRPFFSPFYQFFSKLTIFVRIESPAKHVPTSVSQKEVSKKC